MSLNLPVPTSELGVYTQGSGYLIRNLHTGEILPVIFSSFEKAVSAKKELEDHPENIDVALQGEIDVAEALAAEVRAWDEVIAGVTVHV